MRQRNRGSSGRTLLLGASLALLVACGESNDTPPPHETSVAVVTPSAVTPSAGEELTLKAGRKPIKVSLGPGLAVEKPVAAGVIAKQQAFLAEWEHQRVSWSGLSVEEQELRQAALKAKMMGGE